MSDDGDAAARRAVIAAVASPVAYLAVALAMSLAAHDHSTYNAALGWIGSGVLVQGVPVLLGAMAVAHPGRTRVWGAAVVALSLLLAPVLVLGAGLVHIGLNGGV
jgi:hypothetical protein